MTADKKTQCLEDLRMRILTQEIAPGSDLDEATLCERYAMSRTPMREILQRLGGEGYVDLTQNRGAKVASMDLPVMRTFFQTAPMIYANVARLAAENRKAGEIGPLKDIQERFRAATEAGFDHITKPQTTCPAAPALNEEAERLARAIERRGADLSRRAMHEDPRRLAHERPRYPSATTNSSGEPARLAGGLMCLTVLNIRLRSFSMSGVAPPWKTLLQKLPPGVRCSPANQSAISARAAVRRLSVCL